MSMQAPRQHRHIRQATLHFKCSKQEIVEEETWSFGMPRKSRINNEQRYLKNSQAHQQGWAKRHQNRIATRGINRDYIMNIV
jgi:hypothetical protein